MSKKTKERRLSPLKERFLLALHKGIVTTAGLKASLEIDTRKFYTESGNLENHEYIESLGYATWALAVRGQEYVTTWLGGVTGQPFEDKEVQDFLTLFPEPYQGVLRLTLACCVAKRTKLFEAFKAGFPGTLLIGEAGIGKSPIGDTISWLQGKDPSDVKIDARLLTKGELGGRLEWYGKKGHRKRGLALSFWQKQDYAQIEEIDKVINRDVSGIIKVIAHAEKDFIREGKKYPNRTVPFLTMNIGGKQGQVALDKIDKAMGIPFIKRNNILFCNPYKGYLDDPSKFFRRVLGETPEKIIPTLTLNVLILKTELSDVEFNLLARLIKEGMLPDIDNSHCDKRGVGIEVLAYHALTGNKDITSATYRIVKDRLQALESLGLTCESWRTWYNKEWLEYEGKDPTKAEQIRRAIERQKELEDSIPVIDIAKGKHNGAVDLAKRHSKVLDDLRDMRDFLDFPITRIKNIKEAKVSQEKLKELCRRYKRNHKGLRNKVVIEINTLKEVTEDNVRIGKLMVEALLKEVHKVRSDFISDIQGLMRPVIDDDPERRETAKNEMKALRRELNQNELMQKVKTELKYIRERDARAKIGHPKRTVLDPNRGKANIAKRAIETLRAESAPLSEWLSIRINRPKKDYPLRNLENDLATAKVQASPMLAEFKENVKTYLERFGDILLGGGKEKERPPDEPGDIFGSGGMYGSDLP